MDCTEYLLKLLGTYKVFEYNTHLMHRQVVGPLFEEFHETMKEHYEYAETTMDDVAERIRMLGGEMPTKMCELVEKSSMNFLSSTPDMQTAIQLVVKMHDYMI
jgi:starvation-inducible DNA-binding protein